jgi:hypothetical protein
MAKFKSIATGEVYEFTAEHDIEGMRVHSEYEEVVEEEVVVEEKPKKKKSEPNGE